jgi:hypothetical protein
MVRVDPIRIADIRDEKLTVALRRWHQLCGEDGLYPREQMGFGLIVGTPEIMNGRSGVVATDADDPLNYVIAFYGSDFNVYDGKSFVATRFRDFPDQEIAQAVVGCYREAITERKPIAHRLEAKFDDTVVSYDRVILPTINQSGKVDRLITLSQELERSDA